MNDNSNAKKINFIINIVYIMIIVFVLYIMLRYAFPILLPFIIAIAVSYIAEPAVRVLRNKLKISRSICCVVCISVFLILLIGIVIVFSITVISKLTDMYENIPGYVGKIVGYFNALSNKSNYDLITPFEQLTLHLFEYIKSIDFVSLIGGSFGNVIINSFSGFVVTIPYIMMTLIITFVSSIFISISFCEIKNFILLQFSPQNRNLIFELKHSVSGIFKKYVKSYAALMLITFLELTVFFAIFKIQPAATIAFIISVVDILPVLGVGTVMIPWAVLCFIGGNVTKGFVLLSIYAVITVVRQIIEPKIIGESIGLHPVVTLIAIYVGLKLLGILGMFIFPILIILARDMQNKGFIHLWKEKC